MRLPNSQENQAVNERLLKQSNDRIKGREDIPAEQVFKNIQIPWLKTVPAGLFLRIMNGGYSRALGVNCTHCHVEEDFSGDDKREKRLEHAMARMHRRLESDWEKWKTSKRRRLNVRSIAPPAIAARSVRWRRTVRAHRRAPGWPEPAQQTRDQASRRILTPPN